MPRPAGARSSARDDETLCQVLQLAMQKRGFAARIAHDVDSALQLARTEPPEYAIVDLSMPGDSGLVLIPQLKELEPHMRIVVLTGYASVARALPASSPAPRPESGPAGPPAGSRRTRRSCDVHDNIPPHTPLSNCTLLRNQIKAAVQSQTPQFDKP